MPSRAGLLGEALEGKGDVMQAAGQIQHLQIDELDAAFLGLLANLGELAVVHDPPRD